MDIRELTSFYHTARLHSVSRAADYLQIGQPTVTTHLQRLEKELGVMLFDRIKRPIRLTTEGESIFELTAPVIQAVEQGLESIKQRIEYPGQQGAFTIGAYPDLALNYLPQAIKRYQQQYPEVQIKLVTRPYAPLVEMIESGEVDLALAHAPEPRHSRGNLVFQALFESPLLLITPLGHPLTREHQPTLQTISRWPLLLLSPQSYMRHYIDRAFRDADLEYQLALEMDHIELIKRYTEIGMGIAIAQGFDLRAEDSRNLGVTDLSHLFPPARIGVATLQGKFLPRAAGNFIEALIALPGHPAPSAGPSGARG